MASLKDTLATGNGAGTTSNQTRKHRAMMKAIPVAVDGRTHIATATEGSEPRFVWLMSTAGALVAFAEARYGDNVGSGFFPESSEGPSATPLTIGHLGWDANLLDGLDSLASAVVFTAAPDGLGNTKLTWKVKGKSISRTIPGVHAFRRVEIVAGVRTCAALTWTGTYVKWGAGTAKPVTPPVANSLQTCLMQHVTSPVAAPTGTWNSVTVTGNVRLQTAPPVYLAPDDVYAQVYLYT